MTKKINVACDDQVGSTNTGELSQKYVAPDYCVGTVDYTLCDDSQQEAYAVENINMGGTVINVFKLLGVHEQGRLIDLVGDGSALNNSGNVFDTLASNFVSPEVGVAVLQKPSWVGYDFGVVKTSNGHYANAPGVNTNQHITSLKILQPTDNRRALQIRVERSDGGYKLTNQTILGVGNGIVDSFSIGYDQKPGKFLIEATSNTQFNVYFTSVSTVLLGTATLGVQFKSSVGSFKITNGTTPFTTGDLISIDVSLDWFRVDVINLPNDSSYELIRIKQSVPSRYWRIVPTVFSGVGLSEPWEVQKIELFDYAATSLDDIQDWFWQENRDRDYSKISSPLKVVYSPVDSVSDLNKFGFQLGDSYTFSTPFATMVNALGRPIVVGDIFELPSEKQFDHNLLPIKKYLEVTDAGWSASGYTTQWRPVIYKFTAENVVPSQENKDLFGTADTQQYSIDDIDFVSSNGIIQTGQSKSSDNVAREAEINSPEKGANNLEIASGTNRFGKPGSYDGIDLNVQDGLPPDGQDYTEGFVLPDVAGQIDGAFFRLNYSSETNIPSRLYRFNAVKNKWEYIETDRRGKRSSHRASQRFIFNNVNTSSLKTGKI